MSSRGVPIEWRKAAPDLLNEWHPTFSLMPIATASFLMKLSRSRYSKGLSVTGFTNKGESAPLGNALKWRNKAVTAQKILFIEVCVILRQC